MLRRWLIPILIVIGVFAFSSQGLKSGPEVSVKETIGLLKGDPRPVLIDVRERADYEQGHLPGAISAPFAEFKNVLESLKLPKIDPVVLYSADEARARDATRLLYESGYQGALTLKGGIEAWRAAGQAIDKSQAAAKP
ncbi:MAG TPA: rhodanese-like domain-containing protein [Burkholderiales bacterium]|nr:rhodanese-like domain-containing protein [Burkholderiales bacterium]